MSAKEWYKTMEERAVELRFYEYETYLKNLTPQQAYEKGLADAAHVAQKYPNHYIGVSEIKRLNESRARIYQLWSRDEDELCK